jgi:hypothetical protein
MTDGAALLADEVLPAKPIRQWVLSLPFALRFLLATVFDSAVLAHVSRVRQVEEPVAGRIQGRRTARLTNITIWTCGEA